VGQGPRTGETRVVEVVSSLRYFLMNIDCRRSRKGVWRTAGTCAIKCASSACSRPVLSSTLSSGNGRPVSRPNAALSSWSRAVREGFCFIWTIFPPKNVVTFQHLPVPAMGHFGRFISTGWPLSFWRFWSGAGGMLWAAELSPMSGCHPMFC
jgi:hypothetical protein